jgi:hypothetical protein
MQKEWQIGDTGNLKQPQYYKGYRWVEVIDFDGVRLVVRTESGWEFSIYKDELED